MLNKYRKKKRGREDGCTQSGASLSGFCDVPPSSPLGKGCAQLLGVLLAGRL